jgi:hypothetical protein
MLAAARRSGLFSVWAGWEGDEKNLGSFNASGKQGLNREAAVKQMQDAGIDVTLFVVLGGRQDSIDSFKRTLELSERLQVGIHPVLLTPLPGTELYDEYRDHLLPGLGWESFTGVNAVFEHPSPDMTPVRREEEYHRLSHELFRFERIVNRIGKISSEGFPSAHIYSFMMQVPMKHALSKAYEEWKENPVVSADVPESAGNPVLAVQSTDEHSPEKLSDKNAGNQGSVPWFWVASLMAITVVDGIEAYYIDSTFTDTVEVILFLNSFLILIGYLYLKRKLIYRKMDVLIDSSREGLARKSLLIRLSFLAVIVMSGQYWSHLCAFHH